MLSILSRDEQSKISISKDGLDLILNAMNLHIDKIDVQEVGCELIWSLAFKNNLVKEMIAKYGGTLIIVRALKRHHRSADFLKNACGALSNICQWRANQESIASQGGLPPLVSSLHVHIENVKILPFLMDAIASLIVSNEDNGRTVSSLGLIPLIISTLGKYPSHAEIVKSGCHALAILTDVKGQASKISYAGGVAAILHVLHLHPSFVDLHRVAFVVLLRMLQESVHVARDIVQTEGVRVLLESLNAGGAQDDTVAAVTHILYTVTNPSSAASSLIESQLWQASAAPSAKSSEDEARATTRPLRAPLLKSSSVRFQQSMLGGLVQVLGTYANRRDVVRSAVRTLNHVMPVTGVAAALNGLLLLDSLLRCAARFQDLRDIHECVASLLRQLATRRLEPALTLKVEDGDVGFLTVFKARISEEEGADALIDLSLRVLRIVQTTTSKNPTLSSQSLCDEIFSIICKRVLALKNAEGQLKKPLRYFTALVTLLEYLSINAHHLTDEITRESSVLDCIVELLEDAPLLQQDIKGRVAALRSQVERQRSRVLADASRSAKIEGADTGTIEVAGSEEAPDSLLPSPRLETAMSVIDEASVKQDRSLTTSDPLLATSPANPEPIQSSSTSSSMMLRAPAIPSCSKLQLVYESASAAGMGVPSRIAEEELPYELPPAPEQPLFPHSLSFDSEFESGNLLRAIQRDANEYDLMLRCDLHTNGHTQWFYFAVTNTHPPSLVSIAAMGLPVPGARVKFNIVNLTKPDSLFNSGMQMVMYSKQNAVEKNLGWVRAGSEICYYPNQYPRRSTAGEGESNYFTLSFTIEFPNPKDTYLLAYTYPYTHSDYLRHIDGIMNCTGSSNFIRRSKICRSLGGYDCDLLIVTNFLDNRIDRLGPLTLAEATVAPRRSKNESKNVKPCLFFSARVHPGETQASWMMQGMLDFLVSAAPAAQFLREAYVIFLVPMLNIDGVVYGNSRCGLAGVDLNRMWRNPTPQHPSVLALKSFMVAQKRCRDIAMFVDFHGHTRKQNVFMYGCGQTKRSKIVAQAFPKFLSLSKTCKKYISFSDCSFHVKKSRESTARVVVCKELGVARR